MSSNSFTKTEHLLRSVLLLLNLLPRPTSSSGEALSGLSILGLELLHGINVVIYEAESGALSSAEISSEAEHDGALGGNLVVLGKLGLDLFLGDVGGAGMDHIQDLRVLE